MSPRSKKEYVEAIFLRYKKASCKERTIILDEFCATCGYHRKHAIRLLRRFRRFIKPKIRKRGRSPVYHRDLILKPLKQIWLAANLPCSKRLKAILPLWLPGYVQSFGNLPPEVSQALLNISAYTIDCVDIATGWTEQRAVWGKGETAVLEQIKQIETSLPFPLLGFDSDNGSEFLNHHLLKHFAQRKRPVQFTRSRAYHKDDNAHVESRQGGRPTSVNGSATNA